MVSTYFDLISYSSITNACTVLKLDTLLTLSENTSYDLRSAYEILSPTLHYYRR
jgi:hypothetical protein